MASVMRFAFVCFLSLWLFAVVVRAMPQNARRPLEATTLVALVAGNALPENIVTEVGKRGLAFAPTEGFKTQLATAGAAPDVLRAISKATVRLRAQHDNPKLEAEGRQHLALAGNLIRNKEDDGATKEVDAALRAGASKAACGFVMGEVLRRREEWVMAIRVWEAVVRYEPDFPEAHTKLSFALYQAGQEEESLREAKAALQENADNAEAHKNAGLALESARKFDAAEQEFREALRLKPDYENVRFDLGILFYSKNDIEGAIAEYKKALALNPRDADAHGNLGLAYANKKEYDSAVRELFEAKKLDPKDLEVRRNLGSVLISANLIAQAITELRELEAMAPEAAVCHLCLASALTRISDFESAKKEYKIAVRLEPENPRGHEGLGIVYQNQQNFPAALKEYAEEARLDPDAADGHWRAGYLLLGLKDTKKALAELEIAEGLEPGNAKVHGTYARALAANGASEKAKGEFQEALLLSQEDIGIHLDFAEFLETQGDWVGAMEQYNLAKKSFLAADGKVQATGQPVEDAEGASASALLRLNQHLSDLRGAGKSAEAAELETKLASATRARGTSGKLDAAIAAGRTAFLENNAAEAELSFKEAVGIAEQMKPHEGRLVMALGFLGTMYYDRKDFPNAQAAIERQLQVAQEIYGANSPQLGPCLVALGNVSMELGDASKAEKLYLQNLDLYDKNFGPTSAGYASALHALTSLFYSQKQFAKALPYAEKEAKVTQTFFGIGAPQLTASTAMLCLIYDGLERPAMSAPCYSRLIPLMEKTYGRNSSVLADPLTNEAKALRNLDRGAEAEAIEKRSKELQQPVAGVN